MSESPLSPRIKFSEWLPNGIMVHFEGHDSVFFAASFLYEQRSSAPNEIFGVDDLTAPKAP